MRPPSKVPTVRLTRTADDGWGLQEESTRRPTPAPRDARQVSELIRDALTILDGAPPEQVALSGDGWALVEEPLTGAAALRVLVREALDEAESEGWRLDGEDPEAPPQYSIKRRRSA